MSGIAKMENLKELVLKIRDESVLLDADLAVTGSETSIELLSPF